MDNFNDRNFYGDDDWQTTSTPVVKTFEDELPQEEDDVKNSPKVKRNSKHPVLTFQLTVAIIALLLVFGLKFLGMPLYETVVKWYEEEISKSVIYNGDFENFDFSLIFATEDEA